MNSERLLRRTGSRTLAEDLVRQIEEGILRTGDPIRSAKDLAVKYKISYVTAHAAIQRLARAGYCVRISGRGTFVSDKAPRVDAVGIPAYHESNPFLSHMVEELTMGATKRGIHAVVGRAVRTSDFIERLLANGVKAMIRFPGSGGSEDLTEDGVWRLLKDRGMRAVTINDFWRDGGPLPHVCIDEATGVSQMMDHLVSLGHKRILIVQEVAAGTRFRALEAYGAALARHGLAYDPRNVMYVFTPEKDTAEKGIRLTAQEMLKQGTAAIVMYDLYALQLLNELKRQGVAVGRDFSLAGFDGIHEAEVAGLSTVVQPLEELVNQAFRLLQDRHQEAAPKVRVLPSCVFRSSTGPCP